MPQFADPTDPGTVWIWDAQSKSYIKAPDDGLGPDMNHSTGGDNDLFNQNQIEHSEQYGNPLQEGHMATVMHGDPCINQVVCPMCQESTDQRACPTCNKDLTPEWNNKDNADVYNNPAPQEHRLDGMPERAPKPNAMKTDNSFPSMISHFEMIQKIASRTVTANEWDNMFGGDSPEAVVEVGKWLQDLQGHMYFEHGVHALHENLAARHGIPYPNGVGALGSVYNTGTADTQRVFPGFQFDLETAQQQLDQAFGGHFALDAPIERSEDMNGREKVFAPEEIQGGFWAVPPTSSPIIVGTAWVKDDPKGEPYMPNNILVANHLQLSDKAVYDQGARAIVCATGGAGSHAAVVAAQQGVPYVGGLGQAYTKIETGNYLKIEPNTKTITVSPGPTSDWTPADKQQGWDNILQFQRQRGGHVTKPEYFAHIDEELAWRQANDATLDSCPECHSPMIRQASESVCHTCGHKQPTIVMTANPAAALIGLRALAPGLMGGGAEAGAAGGMGGLMTKALQGGAFQTGMNAVPGGQTPSGQAPSGGMAIEPPASVGLVSKVADTFGEDEDGWATKDRGEDENPNHGGSSDKKGDGVEQLKDVNDIGGTKSPEGPDLDTDHQADPEMQDKAMKAFHLNLPLVMEFADSDEAGIDNPILRALDELLEEAFPGYKDGFDQEDGATQSEDHPLLEAAEEATGEDLDGDDEEGEDEEHVEKVEPADDDKEKANQVKAASLWDFVANDSLTTKLVDKAGNFDQMMPQPNGLQAQPGVGQHPTCPMCGQSHIAGTPCPDAGLQQQQQNQMLQTMQSLIQPGTANGPVGPPSPTKVVTRVGSWIAESDWHAEGAGYPRADGYTKAMEDEDLLNSVAPQEHPEDNEVQCSDCRGSGYNEIAKRSCPFCDGSGKRTVKSSVDPEFAFYASGEERVQADGVGHSQQPHHLNHPDKNGSEWIDESGAEIQEGQEYEMKTGNHAIPDRVTIERVLPDKITYTVDSGDVTYRHELTKQQVETDGTTFVSAAPADQVVDSADGFEDQEDPIRPGQDSEPQIHDLSTPSTVHSNVSDSEHEVVSLDTFTGAYAGDAPEDRTWLLEGTSTGGVDVDPGLMAKLAGKDYDAREQRAFIDESGEARNLDRLDLEGTHYITDDTDEHFNW